MPSPRTRRCQCNFAPPCRTARAASAAASAGGGHALHRRQHHEAEPADQHDPRNCRRSTRGLAHPGGEAGSGPITYKSVVITGPIFTHSDGAIGNGVTVPHAYYRVVMDLAASGPSPSSCRKRTSRPVGWRTMW